METQSPSYESFEISPRFRATVELRIAKLERDAASDELALAVIENTDQVRRHSRLVAIQLEDALRMRIFLYRSKNRQATNLIQQQNSI